MNKVETYKLMFGGWANQIASRFDAKVYLVGSVLYSDDPRDVDIRVVIPDDLFEARYGSVLEWIDETWRTPWGECRQKWSRDIRKIGNDLARIYHLNIDFQIDPESVAKCHGDRPRVRLDDINFEGDDLSSGNS